MTSRASTQKDVGNGFMEAVIPLLKEFTEKLEVTVRDADRLRDEYLQWFEDEPTAGNSKSLEKLHYERYREVCARLSRLLERVRRLTPAINDLDRRVSQMIEHGQLESELDRVELKLRLNDLEDTLSAAQNINPNVPTRT